MNELHTLLKYAVMIRRLKCEVMDQLPPKRRQVIYLDISSEFTHWMKEHAKKFALLRKQLGVGEGGDDEGCEHACDEGQDDFSSGGFHENSVASFKSCAEKLIQAIWDLILGLMGATNHLQHPMPVIIRSSK